MTLRKYIERAKGTANATSVERMAKSIGVAPSTLYRWIEGAYPVPLPVVMQIRDLTEGAVQPEDWPLPGRTDAPKAAPDGKAA